jgi:trigger factor
LNILSEKKLENAVVELEIEIPVERVEIEYKAVFHKIQKNAKVDGFRQGKAPVQVVETKYKEYAGNEVAENLVKSTFYDAVEKKELAPIVEPKIAYEIITRDEPFKYKAVFEVMPSIELGEYTSVKSEEKSCNITDADVETEIESVRERSAETNVVEDADAAVKKGNLVKFNLKRTDNVSKEEADLLDYKEYSIVVGKSKDEFTLDNHLMGMKKGESKSVSIKYPEDYHIKDFAGQNVTYAITVNEISTIELPAFDDEFAKKSNYESAEDMKIKTREYLEKFVKDRVTTEVKNDLINKIVEKSTFDIPETMVLNEMYSIFKKTQQRVGYNAESIEQFAMVLGIDPEEYRIKLREDAVKSIKNTLVLSEVAKKEDIKAAEEKYQEIITNISVQMGKTVDEIEEMIEQNQSRPNIEHDIILDSAMEVIYGKADIKKLPAISLEEFAKSRM